MVNDKDQEVFHILTWFPSRDYHIYLISQFWEVLLLMSPLLFYSAIHIMHMYSVYMHVYTENRIQLNSYKDNCVVTIMKF